MGSINSLNTTFLIDGEIVNAAWNPTDHLSIVQICSEWNSKALQTYRQQKNVVSSVRIQLRGFGARDRIVNFVARLKAGMLGLRVVTAVSSPRFWVTHSPPTTGVLSNSLFLPRPLGCLRDQLPGPLTYWRSPDIRNGLYWVSAVIASTDNALINVFLCTCAYALRDDRADK